MKSSPPDLLVLLAEEGAHSKSVSLTSVAAAKKLGVSQQTASRWLKELERDGSLERTQLGLRLSSKAVQWLERVKAVLERKPALVIEGIVVDGLRDGAYYMSQPGYRKQFKKLLGFTPFVGTLNLKLVSQEDANGRALLQAREGILVKEFTRNGHLFGAVKCFPARLNDRVEGAVIMPVRTHHASNIIEVIAPFRLRDKLRLRNGSRVVVEVQAD